MQSGKSRLASGVVPRNGLVVPKLPAVVASTADLALSDIRQCTCQPRRLSLFGVDMDAFTLQELTGIVATAVAAEQRWVIGNHNLHSIYVYYHDSRMRQFYEMADFVHVDGMAVVALGRICSVPIRKQHRVTYADWIQPLMAAAARTGWRVFYLGGKPGVAMHGAELLRRKYPGLQISAAHGYFDSSASSEQNTSILAQIRDYQANVLMVGMGMPRQEHWVLDNLDRISANAILMSGAAMDYVAGAVPTPPRWAGQVGLEWLFRLAAEPKRLWRRYLIEPWFIGALLVRHMTSNFAAKLRVNGDRHS